MNQGDLLPVINLTAVDARGDAVNLTGYSSVKFQMWNDVTGEILVNSATGASIPSAAAGSLRYTPQAGMSDQAGDFDIAFEVTFSGNPLTFPNAEHGRAVLHIRRQGA